MIPSDEHKIVIRAEKRPASEHGRRFNAPTLNEIAILVVGQSLVTCDIVVQRGMMVITFSLYAKPIVLYYIILI